MSYRDKTYVIFDGDNDMWAYAFMKGWKNNDKIDFDFEDSHDMLTLTRNAQNEDYIKGVLKKRLNSSKQFIVLVGESTKNLYKFVRWEIEIALSLGLPPIVVNLNNIKSIDANLCPPILKGSNGMHIPFKLKIIKYALDNWPSYYRNSVDKSIVNDWNYNEQVYQKLGILK
ncbi:MAG: TIR domain-containing protein [Phycisphaerae bacterium]|nr:TIR domain-containing protein [Phycisphaerae bacterium]